MSVLVRHPDGQTAEFPSADGFAVDVQTGNLAVSSTTEGTLAVFARGEWQTAFRPESVKKDAE